ncbi:hypothetical protein Dip518_000601 [Parelusimicrobium proximum]|uniref:hypothetical protein n=1 Tax=Parelusimicrobium proximum TaxID=3228953 RepID=UPI003D1686C7
MDGENKNHADLAKFLDQFEKDSSEIERAFSDTREYTPKDNFAAKKSKENSVEKEEAFRRLEDKINELEQKFEVSVQEKNRLARELDKTKEEVAQQRGKEEFFNNIATTITTLKESIERMSMARNNPSRALPHEIYSQGYYYGAPIKQLSDEAAMAGMYGPQPQPAYPADSAYMPENKNVIDAQAETIRRKDEEISHKNAELNRFRTELAHEKMQKGDQESIITNLKEKTSRLKAVNIALEKEFKRVQDEKVEALRKSAEQAKEILSLREQLSKAEEKFNSFDFEGRIISIKNQYQQKVTKLENQLQELSAVCMKQVEEIENIKTENLRLKKTEEEHILLKVRYEEKVNEAASLKAQLEEITKKSESMISAISTDVKTVAEAADAKVAAAKEEAAKEIETLKAELNAKEIELAAKDSLISSKDNAAVKLKEAMKKEVLRLQEEITQKQNLILTQGNDRIKDIVNKANTQIAVLNSNLMKVQKERDSIAAQLAAASVNDSALIKKEREQFEETLKTLTGKMKQNDSVIESLKKKIEVLDNENRDLKSKREKAAAPQQETVKDETATLSGYNVEKKDVPAAPVAGQANDIAKARAARKAEARKTDGERDFLEDTQSFLGRLRWSLLKDD